MEKLAFSDTNVCNWSAEQWVVNGYLMYANKKYERAAFFGSQAIVLDKSNIEALLLKAKALLEYNKYDDVIRHCVEFRHFAPYR